MKSRFFLEPCGFLSLTPDILLPILPDFFLFLFLKINFTRGKNKTFLGEGKQPNTVRPPWPHLFQISPSQDVMSKKQEKYAFLFQHPAGSCMQREECLVTLWVFICFLTHMLWNYTGPSISFPHLPPETLQRYAARRQQGSPLLVLSWFWQGAPSPPRHQPLWHKGLVLNMANDFCRFPSTRHARGMPGPPEEVGPPPKVEGVGSESQTSYSALSRPASRHCVHGCTQAANCWTSEQEGCFPVASNSCN